MRKILILGTLLATLAVAASIYFDTNDNVLGFVKQYVENGEFVTLKPRYTPDQIMEAHKKELLVNSQHSYQEPGLKFHPYLLMEVKYALPDKKSKEGTVLWSLVDGEMVINTDSWETTHGFEDAINSGASKSDFKVMFALAKQRSPMNFEQLQRELRIEKDTLAQWVESAISKHLIIQKGNELQLHFQDPKLLVLPETKISDWLVKKPYDHSQRASSYYSKNQIQKVAANAFGDEFTIRTTSEVYLPVYIIEVLNPDGSTLTSLWNALTGQRMPARYSLKGL